MLYRQSSANVQPAPNKQIILYEPDFLIFKTILKSKGQQKRKGYFGL